MLNRQRKELQSLKRPLWFKFRLFEGTKNFACYKVKAILVSYVMEIFRKLSIFHQYQMSASMSYANVFSRVGIFVFFLDSLRLNFLFSSQNQTEAIEIVHQVFTDAFFGVCLVEKTEIQIFRISQNFLSNECHLTQKTLIL